MNCKKIRKVFTGIYTSAYIIQTDVQLMTALLLIHYKMYAWAIFAYVD